MNHPSDQTPRPLQAAEPLQGLLLQLEVRGHGAGEFFDAALLQLRQASHGLTPLIARAHQVADATGSDEDRMDVALLAATDQNARGQWRGAADALLRLIPRLRAGQRLDRLVAGLTTLGDAHAQLGTYVHASTFLREALILAREHRLPLHRAHALMAAGLMHVHFGQLDTARDAFTESRRLMGDQAPPGTDLRIAANLAHCALLAKLPAEAERLIVAGLASGNPDDLPLAHAVALANLSWAQANLGRTAQAQQAWLEARRLARQHRFARLVAPLALNRARILAAQGLRHQALRLGQFAWRQLALQGQPTYCAQALDFLAELAASQGLWSTAYRLGSELAALHRGVGAQVLSDLGEGLDSVLMHAREAAEQRVQRQSAFELDRRVAEKTRALAESESRARWLSERDALTLLANRRALEVHLPQRLMQSPRLCVMSLRLPSLGLVSSVVGLANVDALLRRLASRLQHAMGDENVYSHRDWQFVVCVSTPAALAQPAVLAAELAELVQTLPSGTGVPLAVAVGWALYPEHGQQSDELLQRAELAATGPLHSGERRLRAYTPAMLEEALSRTRLESELRLAIARHELVPYLQPQVDLATGRLHGVEGLVRWVHPQRGLLEPERFIRLAEDTGLVVQIDLWMLDQVCTWTAGWHARGAPLVGAVNLSAKTLISEDFPARVHEVLQRTGLPPSALELELTESTLIEHLAPALRRLQALRDMGVRLALDDFGTGYSSLSYLGQLPISVLKLDQGFVRTMLSDERAAAIVGLIVRMGRTMALEMVAEGVEQPAQALALAALGVQVGQGYLYARPQPLARMDEQVRAQNQPPHPTP